MRDSLRDSGSSVARALGRLHASAPTRRAIFDAAVALSLGTACAFAISFGPAPLNTVSSSAYSPASEAGEFSAWPYSAVPIAEDVAGATDTAATGTGTKAVESATGTTGTEESAGIDSPAAPYSDAFPPKVVTVPPAPPAAVKPPPPASAAVGITATEAIDIVQAARVRSGLGVFVSAESCAESSLFATTHVTPSGAFPDSITRKALAPDQAFVVITDTGAAPLRVEVYTCR